MLFPSVGETLARMVAGGLCTLEDLDKPSPGWAEVERSRVLSQDPCDFTDPYQRVPVKVGDEMHYSYPRPTMKYPAREPYRNLARDWIAANPRKWAAMTNQDPAPTVEVSDPRDFTPTEGATPAQSPDLEVDW
jgi:hypothetical protein